MAMMKLKSVLIACSFLFLIPFILGSGCPDPCYNNPCDNDVFCDGVEFCSDVPDEDSGDPYSCIGGTEPCDDEVNCNEGLETCGPCTGDEDCNDEVFCNGEEMCNADRWCTKGTSPCDEDQICIEESFGYWCANIAECSTNEDCYDPLFCNGLESCIEGVCSPGTSPCDEDQICIEETDGYRCEDTAECKTDEDCDDGLFCNGDESCIEGECVDGTRPCALNECDEATDSCEVSEKCWTFEDCEDGDLCTLDQCLTDHTCHNVPVVCFDGKECNPANGLCE